MPLSSPLDFIQREGLRFLQMWEEKSLQPILPFNHLDANSFNIALYEISHGTLNYNSDRIESVLYNPIEQPGLFDPLSNDLKTLTQTFLTAYRLAEIWLRKILMIRVVYIGN